MMETQYSIKLFVLAALKKTIGVSIFSYFVCLSWVMPVLAHYKTVSGNSLYESSAKWETCQIFRENRLLVYI